MQNRNDPFWCVLPGEDSTIEQAAALALKRDGKDWRVLLVTSRQDGRWILPKGWIEAGEDAAESAAREAYEEAGVKGALGEEPLGSYRYSKKLSGDDSVRSRVTVFPLLVRKVLSDWPEIGQRKRRWMSLEAACKKVGDRGLADLLKQLCGPDAKSLRKTVEALDED